MIQIHRFRPGDFVNLASCKVYSVSGLTTRFLSEFERGKPNASIGRVMDTLQALGLEMLVMPRGEAERLLALRRQSGLEPGPGGEEDA